jgi:hypothetical protein
MAALADPIRRACHFVAPRRLSAFEPPTITISMRRDDWTSSWPQIGVPRRSGEDVLARRAQDRAGRLTTVG